MQYQKSQASQGSLGGRFGQGANGGFARRFGANGGGATGQIMSISGNSMTVQMSDGTSKIVILSSNTSINKADKAAQSDLKTGERVAAFGTTNSDGSITAQTVQINPLGRMGGSLQPTPTQ